MLWLGRQQKSKDGVENCDYYEPGIEAETLARRDPRPTRSEPRLLGTGLFLNDGPSRGVAVQTSQRAARNLTVRAQRAVFVKTSNSTNSPFILVSGLRAILFPSMACLLERQTQLFPFAESDGTRRLAAWS